MVLLRHDRHLGAYLRHSLPLYRREALQPVPFALPERHGRGACAILFVYQIDTVGKSRPIGNSGPPDQKTFTARDTAQKLGEAGMWQGETGVQGQDDVTCAAVVIGRNEGARLVACLGSLRGVAAPLIYVDSGSSDGSVAAAQGLGAQVVALDMAQPFTAARARNAGLARLTGDMFVQLVDGDCALQPGWLATAAAFLRDHPDVAVVCGRRREVAPGASIYNLMCDREWDTPVGEALACGGDAMMRLSALRQVGGYREGLIAGEEPELCQRLRRAGWRIWRLDAEMTLHDAAITRFSQWWRRTRRTGHAFAEGAMLHGKGPDRHWVKETRRALIWGLGVPFAVLLGGLAHAAGWALALIWPAQILRLTLRQMRHDPPLLAMRLAAFSLLGKTAEALGVLGYWRDRLRKRRSTIIEYK